MENDLNQSFDKNERVQLSKDLLQDTNLPKSKQGKKAQSNRQKKVIITLIKVPEGIQFLDSTVQNKKAKTKKKNSMFKGEQQQNLICYALNCGKIFSDQVALRKHAQTHKEKQYICPYENCGKVFLDNSKLRRHLLVHTGEKPFKCEFCGKSFSLDFNLRTHLRTHTGEKPYICNFQGCSKRFTQSSNLSAHEKTHLQIKDVSQLFKEQQERRTYVRNSTKQISQFQLPQNQQQSLSYMNQAQSQSQSHQQPQQVVPVLSFGNPYETPQNVMMLSNDLFSLGQDEFSQVTMATPGFPVSNKNELNKDDSFLQRPEDISLPNYLYMNANEFPFQYENF